MSYIGRQPTVGNFQICDAISVVNGQAAYTMQVGSVNVLPETANHMIVSLNGVIQKPNSSFTVSGSTITFSSNLATGDVIDFIQILGDVLDLGVPSDGTVTESKIGSNAVTSAKMFSGFANGITEADQWRLTTTTNSGTDAVVSSNWERVDTDGYGKIGTGLTNSSGVFSFASTGIYLILFQANYTIGSGDPSAFFILQTTTNNSTYGDAAAAIGGGSSIQLSAGNQFIFDVTDVSNCKFRFSTASFASGTALQGDSGSNNTCFSATRLGDT